MNDSIKSMSTDLKNNAKISNKRETIVSSESGSKAIRAFQLQPTIQSIQSIQPIHTIGLRAIQNHNSILLPDFLFVSNKTDEPEYTSNNDIKNKVDIIFFNAEKEDFSEDIKSNFSIELENLIEEKGNEVLYYIEGILKNIDNNIVYEFLRCIGSIDSLKTLNYRKNILLKNLGSSDKLVMLGSVLGLSFLSDDDFKNLQFEGRKKIIDSLENTTKLDHINETIKNYINTTIGYIKSIK